ncbi:3-isopropylmalate dehydratase small subunit [Pelagerythrobacter sp.]|uniref:3-isopropylmalate dehydratase small subunit n=1 Tax=Pelagerythrobacter sp. TaxID=2800702 RepID=UPI0035B43103
MTLTIVESRAYPLGLANIDTDVIIGSDWLKTVSKTGLGAGVFGALRENRRTVFDDPVFSGAEILVAGANFGCGSSREHAAWALADFGIRVVIAPSFSDIFASNAFKNGILAAQVDEEALPPLMEAAHAGPITVNLIEQTITTAESTQWRFDIEPFRRECLIEGLNEIGLTLGDEEFIAAHEQQAGEHAPWLMTVENRRTIRNG